MWNTQLMERQIWGVLAFGVFGLTVFALMGSQKPGAAREAAAASVYAESQAAGVYAETRACDIYAVDPAVKLYASDTCSCGEHTHEHRH